ncbi:DMT family protein [Mangrovibacterium lignilyticum]|uniref:DMT family protein n=1 Tax=Mangrovibacterium lignilyticum TaxID=2668052 RepID=UPI0019683A46
MPAYRIGFKEHSGPFSLIERIVLQEVSRLVIFSVFTLLLFRNESFRWNHVFGFVSLVLAVYFIFKK